VKKPAAEKKAAKPKAKKPERKYGIGTKLDLDL
jgi:hypothetical protein